MVQKESKLVLWGTLMERFSLFVCCCFVEGDIGLPGTKGEAGPQGIPGPEVITYCYVL